MRYLALMGAGWRRWSSYRAATFAGLFTNTAFGFLRAAVLLAALKVAGPIGGYDLADALTYVWLGQGLIMAIGIWRWSEPDGKPFWRRLASTPHCFLDHFSARAGAPADRRAHAVRRRHARFDLRFPHARARGSPSEPLPRHRRELRDALPHQSRRSGC
jgi:ABC-2 type transport system permease protein